MTPQELVAKLESIDFFENYPEEAAALAKDHILKDKFLKRMRKFDEDWAAGLEVLFTHWPGMRLAAAIEVADEDLMRCFRTIVKQSFGLLDPTEIKGKSLDSGQARYLKFIDHGRVYQDEFYMPGKYLPNEFFLMVGEAFEFKHKLKLHVLDGYDYGKETSSWKGTLSWIIATDRAMDAAVQAKLFPEPAAIDQLQSGSAEQLLADRCHKGDKICYRWIPGSEPSAEYVYPAGTLVGLSCGYGVPVVCFMRTVICTPANLPGIEAWEFVSGSDRLHGLELPLYCHWKAKIDYLDAAKTLEPIKRNVIDEARFDRYGTLLSLTVQGLRKFKSLEPKLFKGPEHAHSVYAAKAGGMMADYCAQLAWNLGEEAAKDLPAFDPTPWPNRKKN